VTDLRGDNRAIARLPGFLSAGSRAFFCSGLASQQPVSQQDYRDCKKDKKNNRRIEEQSGARRQRENDPRE
jgi:hypothetical protein